LTNLQRPELLDLLIAADELNIQTLISHIQGYLIHYRYEFLQQNPAEILEAIYKVYQSDTFAGLWEFFLETICDKPDLLFNSNKLSRLSAPILELLLKRDDLLLDEIKVWNNLINWCLAQHPSIQHDIEKLNKEEITAMERTLQRFISLIRFYHISSEDFYSKVYLFKKLLSKNLINDMLKFHLVPNKKLGDDIQLPRIQFQYFAIVSSWIEKRNETYYRDYGLKDIPYHFKLIYHTSKDDKTPGAFHEKCDNKGPTIVIIKIKESKQIIGGYNPFSWDSSKSYKFTTDSFMFSFTDRKDTKTAKVSYSNGIHSIGCYPTYGPIFGGDFFCKNDGTSWNYYDNFFSYPGIDIPIGNIDVDYYEVFQIIKKSLE
jgi:hypothetical protein